MNSPYDVRPLSINTFCMTFVSSSLTNRLERQTKSEIHYLQHTTSTRVTLQFWHQPKLHFWNKAAWSLTLAAFQTSYQQFKSRLRSISTESSAYMLNGLHKSQSAGARSVSSLDAIGYNFRSMGRTAIRKRTVTKISLSTATLVPWKTNETLSSTPD